MVRRAAQAAVLLVAAALLAFAWHCDAAWVERHVFLPQQFFIVAGPAVVVASRAGAVVLAILVLACVRSAAPQLLIALILAVPAAEGLLRWRMRGLLHPEEMRAMDGLVSPSVRYGWSLRPGADLALRLSGREIRFQTDAEGRRIGGAADAGSGSLIFTGESTVAGVGLQWDETFAAIVGARLRLQPVNLAAPAYRLDQSWLRLRDALPRIEQPAAVVGLFMPGLVGRSFGARRHPLARPAAVGVELAPPETPRRMEQLALYRLWKHLYWSDAALEEGMRSVAATLRDIAALAGARGAPCLFIVTGHTPPWMVRELFEAQGLDFVIVEVPPDELLADGHPGPRGAARIADAIEARLGARGRTLAR